MEECDSMHSLTVLARMFPSQAVCEDLFLAR